MHCLPLWLVKLCAWLAAIIYTETPISSPAFSLITSTTHVVTGQGRQPLAFHIALLPLEVRNRLLSDSIDGTSRDILYLRDKVKYVLTIRTLNKEMHSALTAAKVLEICGVHSVYDAKNAYQNIFEDCPLFIAQAIICKAGFIDINQKSDVMVDGVVYPDISLLQNAVMLDRPILVAQLLKLGADPNILNKHGHTVHNYAHTHQHTIKKLLAPYREKT